MLACFPTDLSPVNMLASSLQEFQVDFAVRKDHYLVETPDEIPLVLWEKR